MNISAGTVISALTSMANEERKNTNQWFFKTGKGQYGEGDVFIGISAPQSRKVAQQYWQISLKELAILLQNEVHEMRLCSLHILVLKYKKASIEEKEKIVSFYLENRKWVNNWDLVDTSAHYILGQSILDGIRPVQVLHELSGKQNMWERRISIVATWILIRNGDIKTTMKLAQKLIYNPEDLMHKAVGWMLREAWKKEPNTVETFLKQYYSDLARTTLRYAIERMEEPKRQQFLKGIW